MADILTSDQRIALQDFLRSQAVRPFRWGYADCGLFLADWMMAAKSLPDPAAVVRGTYHDAETALAAIGAGGLVGFVGRCATICSCPQTSSPIDGDGAVIDIPLQGQTCAVMTNGSWAFRTANGLAWSKIAPGRMVQAWAVFHA